MLDEEVIQDDPQDGRIDLTSELYDKLYDVRKKMFSGGAEISWEDDSKMLITPSVDYDDKNPGMYIITIFTTYWPNDENPIIPQDILVRPVKKVVDSILEYIPEIYSYGNVLSKFRLRVGSVNLYYGEGYSDFMVLLPTAVKNSMMLSQPLSDVLQDGGNMYYLQRVPTFSPDYPNAMRVAIKKLKSVWKALHKGVYNGVPYELTSPSFYVREGREQYRLDDMIINPSFHLSITIGSSIMYGDTKLKFNIDRQLFEDITNHVKKRFEQFNVRIS